MTMGVFTYGTESGTTTITGIGDELLQSGDSIQVNNVADSFSNTITLGPVGWVESDKVISVTKDNYIILDGPVVLSGCEEPLQNRLDRIEKILGISPRYPSLENEFPDLATAGEQMDTAIHKINQSYIDTISNVVEAYKQFAGECEVMKKLKSENGET